MFMWAEPPPLPGDTEGVLSSGEGGGCSKSRWAFNGGEAGSENGSGLLPTLDFFVADIGSRMVKLSERIAEAGLDSWALVTGGVCCCCVMAGPDRLDRPPAIDILLLRCCTRFSCTCFIRICFIQRIFSFFRLNIKKREDMSFR